MLTKWSVGHTIGLGTPKSGDSYQQKPTILTITYSFNVTTISGAALGTVVERAGKRDVHKACIAVVRASVSP